MVWIKDKSMLINSNIVFDEGLKILEVWIVVGVFKGGLLVVDVMYKKDV